MYLHIETQERITETELRLKFRNISFPLTIKDESIRKFGYAVLHTPEKPPVGEHQEVKDAGVEEFEGRWQIKWEVVNKPFEKVIEGHPRIAEIKKALEALDLRSIRPLRALVLRRGDKDDYDVLDSIDKERTVLIQEMQVLTEAARMVTGTSSS